MVTVLMCRQLPGDDLNKGVCLSVCLSVSVHCHADIDVDSVFPCSPAVCQWLMMLVSVSSVQLARRVLQLERSNVSLNKELERQQQRINQLTDEVSCVRCYLYPAGPRNRRR